MRILAALACLALACHETPKPQAPPSPKPAPATPAVAERAPEPPPKPSCTTVAGKLIDEHGFGKIPDKNKAGARRGGEAEIVASCLDDRWPDAVIDCMTTRPSAASCLGQLSTYQQKSYDLHVRDWERKWMAESGDAPGEDDSATEKTKAPPAKPREEWVSCEISAPGEFAPVIAANARGRELAINLRAHALETACYRWANPDKKCFNAAHDAAAIKACRDGLDDTGRNTLDNLIADADDEVKKIAALEKNAKAIDCKVIANAHYGDDAWRGHLVALPAAERKRVAAESRAKLAKACVDDKWTAPERACLVERGAGEQQFSECFSGKPFGFRMRWGFPAGGVVFKTGIADCDQLGDVVRKIATCDKFDKDMRGMILDSWTMEIGRYLEWHGTRDEMIKSCKQTGQMYTEAARERGCAI